MFRMPLCRGNTPGQPSIKAAVQHRSLLKITALVQRAIQAMRPAPWSSAGFDEAMTLFVAPNASARIDDVFELKIINLNVG